MGKIFRLHSGADGNVEHWKKVSNYLDHKVIDTIKDPSGLSAMNQITSIPTPFARMDLVKSAFLYVASNNFENECVTKGLNPLDGKTIYHKLISDALDIAEIFYNIEAFQDKVEILEWHSGVQNNGGVLSIKEDSDLGRLLSSTNKRHKLLGETLEMFIKQDSDVRNKEYDHFNFSEINHIYLLNYKAGPERLNIIGGTSPTTLFFTTANDLSYVDLGIGNDKFFDEEYCSLFRRSKDFIKWMYQIQLQLPEFSLKMKGLNDYFAKSEKLLDNSLINLDKEWYEKSCIDLAVNSPGNFAEILGFKLKTKKYDAKVTSEDNDFIIAASKNVDGDKPCMLPINAFNVDLRYGNAKWQKDWYKNVPFYDERPLIERTLPNQPHVKYPYLTVSDLLEPYLIRVPYPIDKIKFFDGNYLNKDENIDHGYILPIKKEIFNYFSIEDLKGNMKDGKKMIEIKPMPAGALVTLRIPIKGHNYIEVSRVYIGNVLSDNIEAPKLSINEGVIIENQCAVAIYPFVKFEDNINPHYRIMLVDRDVEPKNINYTFDLNFYSKSKSIQPTNIKIRSNKHDKEGVTTKYIILEENFELIEIYHNLGKGIILPLYPSLTTKSKRYKFAVDFGTSNTHIEYKIDGITKPFDIIEEDIQLATFYDIRKIGLNLNIGTTSIATIVHEEFAPYKLDSNAEYSFPHRTSIFDNDNFNENDKTYALADFNIPFWYLKKPIGIAQDQKVSTNLKWAEYKDDYKSDKRFRGFIKEILLLIRNKVYLNKGILQETELVWFYPVSMPLHRKNRLESVWKEYFSRYFMNSNKLYNISESIAPFYFYSENKSINPYVRPAINIDIGGGTTDIAVYQGKELLLITSFKFAANSIFGDGYGSTLNDNGFILKFEKKITKFLEELKDADLLKMISQIKATSKSSIELIEFFFSLENNKDLKDRNKKFSFSKLLSDDDDLRLVFIIFFNSLIYHISNLMKVKNLKIPEFITFSGNGSKIINIICGGNKYSPLERVSELLFKTVYGNNDTPVIKIFNEGNPKEITCKGGIEINNYSLLNNIESTRYDVLLGDNSNLLSSDKKLKYFEINNELMIKNIAAEVTNYINLFFNLNHEYNYSKTLGINMIHKEEYHSLMIVNIENELLAGLDQKLFEVRGNENDIIEETLFFLPLVGLLNKLAKQITINTINNG